MLVCSLQETETLFIEKTKLVLHSNHIIAHHLQSDNPSFCLPGIGNKIPFNDAFGKIGHLFIDFSSKDAFGKGDVGVSTRDSLGLRIAAHFFFGIGFSELIEANVLTNEQKKQFSFENVCSLISERFCKPSGKHLLLMIQLDEFSAIGFDEKLHSMVFLYFTLLAYWCMITSILLFYKILIIVTKSIWVFGFKE